MKHAASALSVALMVTGSSAKAYDVELMFCALKDSGKMVSVRMEGPDITYAFGDLNVMSDLVLTTPAADVGYQPWPGVGSSVWEVISFTNGDYTYDVSMGFDRAPDSDAKFGGIDVRKNGEEITYLECIPGSVSFPWDNALADAKAEAGLCAFERGNVEWLPCAD